MHKQLRLRFLLLSWGLLMLFLTALCGGIAYYLYSTSVSESETVLHAAMEEFTDFVPAADYTDAGRGLLTARFRKNGTVLEQHGWNFVMKDETLEKLTKELFAEKDEGSGVLDSEDASCRYQFRTSKGEIWFAMTDRTHELNALRTIRHNLMWYLILGGMLLIPISILLSNWASRPIETAWEKQDSFVADATHELKTPLATIAADTEAVLSNPEASVGSQERWLGSIRGETTRMANLVSGLLFLSKMDAHELKLNLVDTAISEKIEELCMDWEVRIFEADKQFDYEMTSGLYYRCDWERIKQMVEELLDNAVKYTAKGKHIRLVMNRDRKEHLRIVVSNEGEPISEKELTQIFDRFYRTDPSRARNTGGYGLGLCVAQCIARLHGGDITAVSSNGINAFTIILDEPSEMDAAN